MSCFSRTLFGCFLGGMLATGLLSAAEKSTQGQDAATNSDAQTVDLFEGIRNGDLAVKFVPRDSREARLTVENKTKKPLNVKLPDSFAGVPVLAQAGAAGGGQRQQQQQAVGGGGGGGGMGQFDIPPEKVESIKLATVCLEHGKGEPHPTVPYEIRPLDSVTQTAGVQEICQALGEGKINQRIAQAVAWHLNNNMSWDQLASKRLRHANGSISSYFTMAEIQAAIQVSAVAEQAGKKRLESSSPTSAGSSPTSAGK